MITDLSTRHDLVSDLFSLPQTLAEWQQYKLTDEQVAFYKELFLKEFNAAKKLSHKNIVAMNDSGLTEEGTAD